jgi:ABC-type multidrug transport system fused ATPase/permease subunit
MRADRVVVLDGSSITEIGAPHELAVRGGAFARLFGPVAPVAPLR